MRAASVPLSIGEFPAPHCCFGILRRRLPLPGVVAATGLAMPYFCSGFPGHSVDYSVGLRPVPKMPYIQLPHFLPEVPVEPFAKLDRGVLHLLGLRRPGSQRAAYGLVYVERVELVISCVRVEVGLPYAAGYCLDDFLMVKSLGETFPIFVQVCGRGRCPTGLRLGLSWPRASLWLPGGGISLLGKLQRQHCALTMG